MTAAHCTNRRKANDIELHVGEHDTSTSNDGAKVVKVKKIHEHKNFSWQTFNMDFSILELSEDLVFSKSVRPACLPDDDSEDYAGVQGMKHSSFHFWSEVSDNFLPILCLEEIEVN